MVGMRTSLFILVIVVTIVLLWLLYTIEQQTNCSTVCMNINAMES